MVDIPFLPKLNKPSKKVIKSQTPTIPAEEVEFEEEGKVGFPKMSHICDRCGSIGELVSSREDQVGRVPRIGLGGGSVGSLKECSEVLDGFVWCGNVGSSKTATLSSLKFSHVLNLTPSLPNVMENPRDETKKVIYIRLPFPQLNIEGEESENEFK